MDKIMSRDELMGLIITILGAAITLAIGLALVLQ
jgi:hypothetical protein